VTTITTEMILHSNIPTVTNNSRHYSVQTAGRCNTPRYISSLVVDMPKQSVVTVVGGWLYRVKGLSPNAKIKKWLVQHAPKLKNVQKPFFYF